MKSLKKVAAWQKKRSQDRKKAVSLKSASCIARPEHSISRKDISKNALHVLYGLHKAGFQSFLVGGSVRDILLGKHPKDFDIATDATPKDVRRIFRNSRIIGKRFQLVHVYYHNEIIEVSTFRGGRTSNLTEFDNTFGTIEEDAWRRDFSMNALYYNIADFGIYDFTGAMADIQDRRCVMIGDPAERLVEDPVRMLRAVRLSAKLDLTIDEEIIDQIRVHRNLLLEVPPSRLFDELLKIFLAGYSVPAFSMLEEYGLIELLFPQTAEVLKDKQNAKARLLVQSVLQATDERMLSDQTVNPGFLICGFLWPVLQHKMEEAKAKGKKLFYALYESFPEVIRQQTKVVAIPKRFMALVRGVWLLQFHLERCRQNRIYRILGQRYFRAGIDFLALRARSGESELQDKVDWWFKLRDADKDERRKMIDEL